jgi:hypothetical protein
MYLALHLALVFVVLYIQPKLQKTYFTWKMIKFPGVVQSKMLKTKNKNKQS